jgi:hypothetical protein
LHIVCPSLLPFRIVFCQTVDEVELEPAGIEPQALDPLALNLCA